MNLCTYTENFSFTLMGSGDAILCADHPILGQAVIVLHLDYPNCYESQDAFSSGHVECTSLPHRSDVFLAVIGQQPLTLQFFLLSSCEPLFDPFVSLFRAYFIPFLALVHFSLFYTVKESSSSLRSRISYEIVSLAAEAVTTFTDFFFSRVATA